MVFEVRDLWPELPIAMGALRNPILRWVARRLELWAYDHAESWWRSPQACVTVLSRRGIHQHGWQ